MHPLQPILDEMKDCVVSRKYSSAEQAKLAKLFPDEAWYMSTKALVRIDVVLLTDWIRALSAQIKEDGE